MLINLEVHEYKEDSYPSKRFISFYQATEKFTNMVKQLTSRYFKSLERTMECVLNKFTEEEMNHLLIIMQSVFSNSHYTHAKGILSKKMIDEIRKSNLDGQPDLMVATLKMNELTETEGLVFMDFIKIFIQNHIIMPKR